jgi:hypothetical protein
LSVGEMAYVNREYYIDVNSRCFCKKKYDTCKLIKNLINKNKKKNIEIWYKKIIPQTNILIRYFFYLYVAKIKKVKNVHVDNIKEIKKELDIIDQIFPDIILVDSSKSTLLTSNRPYILKKLGYEVIIIHITRPFFSTFNSIKKGTNAFLNKQLKKEKSFKILRFIISYFLSNFCASLLSKNFKYILVRNIDLKKKENYILKKISKLILKIASEKNIKFKKTFENHMVGGNRLRNYLK